MGRKAIDVNKLKGRGKSLYLAVLNSGFTNKEAAQRTKYEEATFYGHIRQEFLDYKIMAKYGRGINHDFSSEYPDITDYLPENPIEIVEKDSKSYRELHNKYTALLEKMQDIIDRNNEKYGELENKYNAAKDEIAELKNEIKALKGKK